jgi:signal transduction histidine kinase
VRELNADLERRVRERTASLQEMVRELNTFAYTVAHDLRAPLRGVHGLGQMLLEDYAGRLDERGRKYLDEMIAAGARMDTLIRDLLEYSRLSREEVRIHPVPVDEIVGQVLQEMKRELADKQAEVSFEPSGRTVLAHAVSLRQAVTNLLSNAIKFVPSGVAPRVRIHAEPRGSAVRLWVEDQGIGIAPEHHGRLFRLFERLHGRDAYPGTGIGLAIVRRAAERMGGSVGLESEAGRGSRFYLDLRT